MQWKWKSKATPGPRNSNWACLIEIRYPQKHGTLKPHIPQQQISRFRGKPIFKDKPKIEDLYSFQAGSVLDLLNVGLSTFLNGKFNRGLQPLISTITIWLFNIAMENHHATNR